MNIDKILNIIDYQLDFNEDKNLFYNSSEVLLNPSIEFKRFIMEHIEDILKKIKDEKYLSFVLKKIIDEVVIKLFQINQYINITASDRKEMFKIYRRTTYDICRLYIMQKDNFYFKVDKIFNKHYLRLKNFLIQTNGKDLFKAYEAFQKKPFVVSSDYSAEFQLSILNINLDELKNPLLDIGCGYNANLVAYLRRKKIRAYGIDRVTVENKYIKKGDWLKFHFIKRKWGSIIAHLSFTNHLLHHYSRDNDIYKRYIEKYYEIVNSLDVGGIFIYTPAVDFLEKELGKNQAFKIEKNNILYKNKTLGYAAKITRIK